MFGVALLLCIAGACLAAEPSCSPFDYEEKLLSKMIRQEFIYEKLKDEILALTNKLSDKLNSIDDDRKSFKNDVMLAVNDQVANELKSIENEREVFMEEVQKLKDTFGADKVAFLAKDVSDTTPTTDQTFIFTTTLFNEGDGYDSDTGMFTAPTGGLYKFDIQLCLNAGSSNNIYLAIMADNKKIQGGFYQDYDSSKCYSADALVRLESGGKVWVKCDRGGGCGGSMWQSTYAWNTFSGFRVNA